MGKATYIIVVGLIAVSLVGLLLFFLEGGGFGGGKGYGAQAAQAVLDYRSLGLVVFAVPLAVALAVLVYALLFPQIKVEQTTATTPSTPQKQVAAAPAQSSQTLEAVLRVLNADEQKIIKALAASEDGSLLQKDIKYKAGLSRVKTHRVLARLVARRLVKAEKYYNTNRIILADWVVKGKSESPPEA
jgi:uncharacterized membrane protein